MRVTYCLIIRLTTDKKIRIGSLGLLSFRKGYYIYVGSAPSYKGYYIPRIERHFRTTRHETKNMFWHIDYFLDKAELVDFLFSLQPECASAKKLSKKFKSIEKFGCSDCSCGSHLFYSEKQLKKFRI